MKKFKLLAFLLAGLSWPISANAESAGTTLFNFLAIDTNVRAVGMGGAYSALAANAGALAYNPAGLAREGGSEVAFMHNQHFQGITQEYLSYASPKGWGASFNYLSFGSIRETTLSNPAGAGLGTVGLTDMALGAGYGKKIGPDIFAGAAVKVVKESVAGTTGQGFMFDGGILWDVPSAEGLTLAAALQNIGPNIQFQDANEPLPSTIRTGAGYRFKSYGQDTAVALDILKTKDEAIVFKLGFEVLAGGIIPIRAGFTTLNDDGPGISVGTGYSSANLSFDYAFVPFKDLGNAHRFSISFRWGNSAKASSSVQPQAMFHI